jgi:hypothetical protein
MFITYFQTKCRVHNFNNPLVFVIKLKAEDGFRTAIMLFYYRLNKLRKQMLYSFVSSTIVYAAS